MAAAATVTAAAAARIIRLTPPQTEYTSSCSAQEAAVQQLVGIIGPGCRAGANRIRVRTSFSVDYIPARSPAPLSGPTPAE